MAGTCSKDESRNSTDSDRSAETRFQHSTLSATCLEEATSSPRELSSSSKRHRHVVLGRSASKKARSHPLLQGDSDCTDEEEHGSFLDAIIKQLSSDHLELSANDNLHLERSARNALRITLGWVEQNLCNPAPCCPDVLSLQLLSKRLELLRQSFEDDKLLDAAQLLTTLFLLVVRGTIFRNVPLEPWDVVDLCGSRPRVNSLPRLRATLLHYLSPLCSCLLPHLLMALPDTLHLCQQLIQDLCPPAQAEPLQEPDNGQYSVRIPSGVRAIVLDLDDTVFLHQQVRQLREVYWVLAQARGSVRGVNADLLRDVVMPAVPNRDFLLRLVDSAHASGRAVYVASFGLNEWVRPVVDLVFGSRIPAERVFSLEGHPPRHPVVLNKNLWLAGVMESHGVTPRGVLLVDDQISNVARAMAGGFSALQVPASRGLDKAIWERSVSNATYDFHLLRPAPRTHAYCPADGAVFASADVSCDADEEAYEAVASQVGLKGPRTPERKPARVAGASDDAEMAEDGNAAEISAEPAPPPIPACAEVSRAVDVDMAEQGKDEVKCKAACVHAPAKGSVSFKDRRTVSHGDLQTALNARHRFILKHKDFEAVRSLTTPPRPASRHSRGRSAPEGPRTPVSGSRALRPPLYQGPRAAPARTPQGTVSTVRMRLVEGPWMVGNPFALGRDVGQAAAVVPAVQSALQCPGLCDQMARLGMAAEA